MLVALVWNLSYFIVIYYVRLAEFTPKVMSLDFVFRVILCFSYGYIKFCTSGCARLASYFVLGFIITSVKVYVTKRMTLLLLKSSFIIFLWLYLNSLSILC